MKLAKHKLYRILILSLVLAGFTAATYNPKVATRLLLRGQYAAMNGSYKAALKNFNKAILLNPSFDTAYYHRGVLKSSMEDINGAIDDFSHSLRLNPHNSLSFFSRGTLYLQHGQYQKALSDLNAAIRLNPRFYDALNNKGVLLSAMGQGQQARQIYDSLLVVYESLHSKKESLEIPAAPQQQTEASRSYAALRARVPRLYFNRSFIKVQDKDLAGALQDLNKTLDINPSDYAAYYQKGEVLFALKDYRSALLAFEKARSLQPKYFYGNLHLGKVYAEAGQTRKAIVLFNQAIRRNQRSGEAYYLRGSARLQQKKLEQAYSDLQLAKILGYSAAAEKLQQLNARSGQGQF